MITFEVKRARRGRLKRRQWFVTITAANGEHLFTSESYNNRLDAISVAQLVISSVQRGAITEAFEQT